MISKSFAAAFVALSVSSLVSGQTHTKCSPLEKTCPNDPAIGKNTVDADLTKGASSAFNLADGTTLTYGSNGAVYTIKSGTDAPTVTSAKYIFFGRIDIEIQAAPGDGIVTSAVLQSDDLDEIDWEWVGGDNAHAQSNYFSKGQTETYDRGAYHAVSNPTGSFHTYSVDWTPTAIQWIIDGVTVRTLEAANAHGVDGFPQTPMQVKLGTWVAGLKTTAEGTVQWAGGYTNFADAPFNAYYKSVKITDYAGQSGPTSLSVTDYIYGDHSGNADSIKVETGSGSSSSSSSSAASSSAAAKTSSAAGSKSTEAASSTKSAGTKSEEKTSATSAVTSASATATQTGGSGGPTGPAGVAAASAAATPAATTLATASGSSTASATSAPATKAPASGASTNGVTFGAGALVAAFLVAQLF